MTGVEDVIGQKGTNYVRDWYERINAKILKPLLIRHQTSKVFDASAIVRAYEKMTLKDVMDMIKKDDSENYKKYKKKSSPSECSSGDGNVSEFLVI